MPAGITDIANAGFSGVRGITDKKEETGMCLSTVYKNEISDANLLAKNVADIRVDGGKLVFTDLMGIRYTFDGTLEKVDLMDNYVIVRD